MKQQDGKNPDTMIVTLTVAQLREIMREEIRAEMQGRRGIQDQLVDITEAARLTGMSKDWLYHNRKRLPFAKKAGPKSLRFSVKGIQDWIIGKNN